MLALILATACSASIALIFKHSETSGMNRYAVTAANYLTACVISLIILTTRETPLPADLDLPACLDEVTKALTQAEPTLSPAAGSVWAVLSGLGAGSFFFLAFVYYQESVLRHGASLAGAFAKLGILVPLVLSLLLWRVYPATAQWCGITLALSSITIVNWPTKRDLKRAFRPALLLLFVFGGTAEFSNKVFQRYGLLEDRSLFLLTTFLVAFCCSVIALAVKQRRVARRDVVTGIAVGIPNLFSSFFLILALSGMPAAVVFPIYSAGTIVVINISGILIFKETLSRKDWSAIALTIVALVLINM